MAKKKSDKTNRNNSKQYKDDSKTSIRSYFNGEAIHFSIGLIFLILAVYLLLVFTSFFFTGAADQSIVENATGELVETATQVQNYGALGGAHVSHFFINNSFGIASYFIIIFLAVAGLKLMGAYKFRLWKWFLYCAVMLIWFSVALDFFLAKPMANSFFYP